MTDLESALRSMLRDRAGDIDTVAVDFTHLESLDVLDLDANRQFDRPAHRTAWLIAAAVAAVLAVVGSAVAISARSRHGRVAPATSSPTTVASPNVLHRSACSTPLPAQWRAAVRPRKYGAVSSMPLAVSPDGSAILVARDFGTARDVALVRGSGAPRSIYTVPQPDENQVENASLDGKYAVIDLDRLPRNSNGVIPAATEVLLVNLSTGSTKRLDRAPLVISKDGAQGRTIDGSLLWNGHVYWDVRKSYADRTTAIRDHDILTGKTTVAGTGGGWIPRLLADGVTFDPQGSRTIAIPRAVPDQVAAATAGRRNFLTTDGYAYAWTTASNQLAWWAPGQRTVTVIAPPAGFEGSLWAVAGNFLAFNTVVADHDRTFVLDARTGATVMLPSETQAFLWSAKGVALGYAFVGAVKESPTAVVPLDTRRLPELRC